MVYDPTTDVGKVRLLSSTTDVDASDAFTDTEIQAFLDLRGDVTLAAATALRALAADKVQVMRKVRLLDLTLDGDAVCKALLATADSLEAQVDGGGVIEIVRPGKP